MAPIKRRHSKEEFADRGDTIYEHDIRPKLKSGDKGKFAAIDIESGAYEVDVDELDACDRLRARFWRADLDGADRLPFCASLRRAGSARDTMISGVVKFDEARIRFKVKGPAEQERQVEAVIDTGYTASLTLPPALIAGLGLRWQSLGRGTLADGSECLFDVYEAEVEWDDKVRRVLVDEADTDPLVGMQLLRGYELRMQVRSQGKVAIKPLPRR